MPARPMRTCIVCRRKTDKGELLRVSRNSAGRVGLQADGRGAYVCKSRSCVQEAFKRKLLLLPLRAQVGEADWAELEKELLERVSFANG